MGNFVFPTRLFAPKSLKPYLTGAAISGGQTISGNAQFAELSGGGKWVVEFGETTLWTPRKVKLWRALAAAADSGATPILVPLADRLHQNLPTSEYTGSDPFGTEIWDDGGNSPDNWTPEEVTATLDVLHDLRSTQVAFTASIGTPYIGGEHFSILHETMGWRLYRLTRVISHNLGTGEVLADIRPSLREETPAGAYLNFESPRCLMRCDGDMDLTLDMLKFGNGSARFVEIFPPLT